MKYLRTKDNRIIDTTKYYIENSNLFKSGAYQEYEKELANAAYKADTIGELCDEFVMTHYFHETNITFGKVLTKENKELFTKSVKLRKQDKDYDPNEFDIYGAVWTDKGLIYVAKMNDKGELELL